MLNFEGRTAFVTGGANGIGLGLALGYLVLMYVFFIRVYRRNLKNGNIARFSAEI